MTHRWEREGTKWEWNQQLTFIPHLLLPCSQSLQHPEQTKGANCWWQAVCQLRSLWKQGGRGKSTFYYLGGKLIRSEKPCAVSTYYFLSSLSSCKHFLFWRLKKFFLIFKRLLWVLSPILCKRLREWKAKAPIYLPSYAGSNVLQNYHGIVLPDSEFQNKWR